jgi:hypothetical protein
MINWHRLFGLALCDYFTGTEYAVEMEKDLARKRQVLDILIIRGHGQPLADPCDGLDALRPHNLVTYKSGQESLDAWAIEELIGHYVNYRKAYAAEAPAADFGLYAVTTRYPRTLFSQTEVVAVKDGVYRLQVVSRAVTLIVLPEVASAPRNALWDLFSFQADKVQQGARTYRWRQPDHVPVLNEIYHRYRELGIAMPYTFEDFRHDLALELVQELPPEERLRGLPVEERLRGLPVEERLRGLPVEERLRGLPSEERLRGLSPEDILGGLDDAERARLKELLERKEQRH